jgi:hypothetical protein
MERLDLPGHRLYPLRYLLQGFWDASLRYNLDRPNWLFRQQFSSVLDLNPNECPYGNNL